MLMVVNGCTVAENTMAHHSEDEIRQEAQALARNDLERAVLTALSLFQNGYAIHEKCPECGLPIGIEGLKAGREIDSVWVSKCGCGACNSTFRGL